MNNLVRYSRMIAEDTLEHYAKQLKLLDRLNGALDEFPDLAGSLTMSVTQERLQLALFIESQAMLRQIRGFFPTVHKWDKNPSPPHLAYTAQAEINGVPFHITCYVSELPASCKLEEYEATVTKLRVICENGEED